MAADLYPELFRLVKKTLENHGVRNVRIVKVLTGIQSECFLLANPADNQRFILKRMSTSYRYNSPGSSEHEYRSLQRFYVALSHYSSIAAPEPLCLFREEQSYLMRYVAALPLDDFLMSREVKPEAWNLVIERIVQGLSIYYHTCNDIYSDFQPNNILTDKLFRVIFLDPTSPDPVYREILHKSPLMRLSADLGYWLYYVSSNAVKQIFKLQRLPWRRLAFTSELISFATRGQREHDVHEFYHAVFHVALWYARQLRKRTQLKGVLVSFLAQLLIRSMKVRCLKNIG